MGNALGKKMEVVMSDSASLVKGKMEGYCERCDMMLSALDVSDKDWEKFYCPRCGFYGNAYTGKDHATRHQLKGGDPWQKSLSK